MQVIFVDDEQIEHEKFCDAVKNYKEIKKLNCFYNIKEAKEFAKNNYIDCAFIDIDLANGENGFLLAKDLKEKNVDIEIAFLTKNHDYARESYKYGGRAFLIKPYDENEIFDAFDVLYRLVTTHIHYKEFKKKTIQIKTFGNFDVMVNGLLVNFKNAKAKEALAFLIHQMGGSVNGLQIFNALWEKKEYNPKTAIYVRRTIKALKDELNELGISNILTLSRNCYSVNISDLFCDSYELLKGDKDLAHRFYGEYMRQYSWGENAIPVLERAVKSAIQN